VLQDDLARPGICTVEAEGASAFLEAQISYFLDLPQDGQLPITLEGRIDMGEKVIINIKTFMDGHRPPDRVLPSML